MPTEKLYYLDAYQQQFEGTIVDQYQADDNWVVVTDKSCFYPGGGGQPFDRGWVNDVPVVAVEGKADEIHHRVGERIEANHVAGRLDFCRRWDYMQQHTGQHIISASFVKVGDYPTVSVHLGESYAAVEIDAPNISDVDLQAIEELANRMINRNLRVKAFWVPSSKLGQYRLRREAPKHAEIRIIEIDDCDRVACGGVHVRSTGDVGLVKSIGMERIRKRVRTHWKIGNRAYEDYRKKSHLASELSQTLTCGIPEISRRIVELKNSVKEHALVIKSLQKELMGYEIEALCGNATDIAGCNFVTATYRDQESDWLKNLAKELVERPRLCTLLFNVAGDRVHWLAARAPDLDLGLAEILKPLLPAADARGGGSRELCQGIMGKPDRISDFVDALKAALEADGSG